jgi:hypothetical protein
MSEPPAAKDSDSAAEPFVQRWARLKARARVEGEPAVVEAQPTTPPAVEPPPAPGAAPAGPALPLPDLDQLGGDSDFSAFLQPGVDLLLRRRALRKLFHSPKFNVLDGLDDYMGDYTHFEKLGDVITADMRHQLERAARAAVDALDGEPPAATDAVVAAGPPAGEAVVDPPADEPGNDDGPEQTA